MVYFSSTSLTLLLGASCLSGGANGFSVVNTIKQQVFSMMELSMPHLTEPNSHFADGIHNPNPKCRSAIIDADEKYPNLSKCFPQMPLFFATLDDVCKTDCFLDTVGGSKLVSENCDILASASNSQRVYNSWANSEAANAACKKVDSSYCLSKVIRAGVSLENDAVRSVPLPREELKKEICLPCTEEFYKAVKKAGSEPVLYYYQIMHADKLFKAFEEYCGYKV
ncbi:hypothetical protein K7432_009480 [Basidiobolus ranarum]|uniref:Uncharacterized protein n=1 Tax=Basidiobolus ranarum TaxID=34480 RepID=A0ABR2WQ96_9FUNG